MLLTKNGLKYLCKAYLTFCKARFILAVRNNRELEGENKMYLKRLLTVSNSTLLLYFLTAGLTFFCWRYVLTSYNERQIILNIIERGGYYKNMDALYHSFNSISTFMAYSLFQVLLAIFLFFVNLIYKKDEPREAGLYCTAIFTSLSFVNIIATIIFLSIISFYLIPSTGLFYSIILIAFALTFCLNILLKNNPNEKSETSLFIKTFRNADVRLSKYKFKNFILIYSLFWLLAIIVPQYISVIFYKQSANLVFIKYICTFIGFIGIAYILLARRYNMKRMDELQRLIQLERANNIFNGLIALILGITILSANFKIQIQLSDLSIPIILLIFVSLILTENKYK